MYFQINFQMFLIFKFQLYFQNQDSLFQHVDQRHGLFPDRAALARSNCAFLLNRIASWTDARCTLLNICVGRDMAGAPHPYLRPREVHMHDIGEAPTLVLESSKQAVQRRQSWKSRWTRNRTSVPSIRKMALADQCIGSRFFRVQDFACAIQWKRDEVREHRMDRFQIAFHMSLRIIIDCIVQDLFKICLRLNVIFRSVSQLELQLYWQHFAQTSLCRSDLIRNCDSKIKMRNATLSILPATSGMICVASMDFVDRNV